QENKKVNVVLGPSFFLRFSIALIVLIALFYILAPTYISFKVSIIKPILAFFYGAKTPPYIRSIPAYRGVSLPFVCFFSLIAASLHLQTIKTFLQSKWKLLIVSILCILTYEIVSIVIEIVSRGFIGYYVTTLLLSVSSILIALTLWFLLFPALKEYFQ
ncbi:MAG: hypothetical protein PHI40_08660, partial [Caldisericia bacterium]|nr:hypothetical protein [Caldisericia bacterium]